jgi:hypothetical protein
VSAREKFQIGDRVRMNDRGLAHRAALGSTRTPTTGRVTGFGSKSGSVRVLRDGCQTIVGCHPDWWEVDRSITANPDSPDVRDKFRKACALLRECTDAGFEIYVAGSGSVHLMSGPTHDADGTPRRDRSVERVHVPKMGGGDW